MNKLFWVLSVSLVTIACVQTTPNNSANQDSVIVDPDTVIHQQDTIITDKNILDPKAAQTWTDSLIQYYVGNSKNGLIKSSLKNKISVEWLFDQAINTDTAKYFVFQIGHDESDENEKDHRLVTDQWIYIDSMTKRIYEYDVANDSLIPWTK